MLINIISKKNQKLKVIDPHFNTDGVDEDDYEYIYCEDFFGSGYADDCIANSIFDCDHDEGVIKFQFDGNEKELLENGDDCNGSADLDKVYERIEDFINTFSVECEEVQFLDESGVNLAENILNQVNLKKSRQTLISFTVFFENFFGYNEKKSMGDLHQLIKHKIFDGNWDEFRSNWSTGLDMYDKIIDGINTYDEGFDRIVKTLKELPLSDDSKKSFLELTLEMYHETSPTSGVIESEINDENQINKQHPNYSKFKIFEYLSNALGDDIVLNFLINN